MADYFESGFSVRQSMWHDPEGKWTIDDYPENWREAQKLAGAEWAVEKRPVMFQRNDWDREAAVERIMGAFASPVDGNGLRMLVGDLLTPDLLGITESKDHFVTHRMDTGAPLGIVSDDYRVVQNWELYEFTAALVGNADVRVDFETGGVLKGGRVVWALVKLPDHRITIPGTDDINDLYVICTTGHDGSLPFQCAVTQVRVVCWNTLSLALGSTNAQHSIRHTGDPQARIQEARDALGLALAWNAEFRDLALMLSQQTMTDDDFAAYTDFLFPMPTVSVTDRVLENVTKRRAHFGELYRAQSTPASTGDFRRIEGTRWAALQAATEYYDWSHRIRDTTGEGPVARRFWRSMVARDETFKRFALTALQQDDIPGWVSEQLTEVGPSLGMQ
jgi:phage/plasmid-like protein (TIGR03299 family)